MERVPQDFRFKRRAIELARLAERVGSLPVGAVIALREDAPPEFVETKDWWRPQETVVRGLRRREEA